ncbi:MAG: EF-hand domain-containing protein [Pseudomonadota bacterium]
MPFSRLRSSRLIGSACALLLAATGPAVLAQTATLGRTITAATPPAANAGAATANALPSPRGLSSPLISSGGLTTQPPTGLPVAPSGASGAGTPLPTTATATGGGYGNGGFDSGGGSAPATNVLGGPGSGFGGSPVFAARGPYPTVEVARSFLGADTDRNGELSRSEAQRLLIRPFSFEEMDRDGNGLLSRGEYEDALR